MAHDSKTLTRYRPYKAAHPRADLAETTLSHLPRWRARRRVLQVWTTLLSTKPPVVAVIDDDLSVLRAMRRLLSTHGFDTELYDSPAKFLDAVITTQAICLIVDIHLGDSCGVEFVRQLANRGITFPVIFMTGSDDEEIAIRAREAGCVAFFRKPFFSAYLLIEALNGLCDSYAVIRPRK